MQRIPCASSPRLASNTTGSSGLFLKEKTPAACNLLCLVSLAQCGVLDIHPRGRMCRFLVFTSETLLSYEVGPPSLSALVREAMRRSHTETTIISLVAWLLGGSATSLSLPLEFCPHSLCDPVHPVGWATPRTSLASAPVSAHLLDNVSWMSYWSLQCKRPPSPPPPVVCSALDRTTNHQAAWTAFSVPSSSSPVTVTQS